MEFQTDPNGEWQYCHSALFGDLSALVSHLPYFEVRSINGVDYVVLPAKVSRGFANRAKFLDAEHVKVHGGRHYFANFLPDGERPANVPAL